MNLLQYGGAAAGGAGAAASNDPTAHSGSNNNLRQDLAAKQMQADAGSSRMQLGSTADHNQQQMPGAPGGGLMDHHPQMYGSPLQHAGSNKNSHKSKIE